MIGDEIRQARTAAGLSLRELARRVPMNPGYLSQIERGARLPSPHLLARISDVVGVPLTLPAEAAPPPTPTRLDPCALTLLADILARQRTLEDVIGAAAVLPGAEAHAAVAARFAADARGGLRSDAIDVAAQWIQFTGWLYTALGDFDEAERRFGQVLALASESGDRDMIATALSFQGHIAYLTGRPGAVVGLSRAAAREARYVGQRAYDAFQEARGHAMVGDRRAAANALAWGFDLAAETAEYDGVVPPWQYYRSQAFFALEGSRVHVLLGDRARATEMLAAGLDGLPAQMRGAEWAADYIRDLEDGRGGAARGPAPSR